ncbi:serine protease 64 isoform X1 [Nasonia vitripennis]|uniref:limulus clotting factor C n=2 Tax=Nasonia vitripennis TaxID=7425 RepID=A0A7M7Q8A5_NASVI|nr:serine protease 64 isoform X1 [Nasonia vitripennis]
MEKGQQREVEKIIVHSDYNSNTIDNDIALLKLAKPIKFNAKQKPIAITTTPPKAGQTIKISGFGYIAEGGPDSPLLKAALAPVVSRKKCQEAYSDDDITENMFCAGKGATDNCEGDSGGPAVIDNKLVGIISWGYECGSPKNPGVYTQIYRYRKWIAKNTGLKLFSLSGRQYKSTLRSVHTCFSFALFNMKLLCLSLTLLIAGANCFYVDNTGREKDKIVGGDYVPITEAPYQAQLLQLGSAICGATIISEYWLVSAAHCFEDTYGMSILTGSTYRSKGGQKHQIEKVIIHRGYDEYTNDNDISLIKLVKSIKFNERQKAVSLARVAPKTGDKMIVSGYGKEGEYQRASTTLKVATVPVVDQKTCARRYIRDPITNNMFCAGKGPTDACQGDSGGPGVIDGKLVGVVSSGMECGSTYYPGIYTRVDKYYEWIVGHTGIGQS